MISSFFSKTKPINYAVLLLFLLFFYVLNLFLSDTLTDSNLLLAIVYAAILLQVVVVQETVRARKTTNSSSFAMLFFVLLLMAIPKVQFYKDIVFSNLFLMISLNRLLALKTLKLVKQKIFDATLWICVASIFDPWTLLFLAVIFLAVYVYGTKEYKNWLVPLVGISFFILLLVTFLLLTKNIDFLQNHYSYNIQAGFYEDFIKNFSIKPFLFIISILAVILVVFIKQGYQGVGRIVHLRILLVYFLVSVLIFSINNITSSNYMVLAYSFFPAAVFATNFLETIKRKRLIELFLVICIVLPFVLLTMDLVK
ncbi:DUF6427 family protein [Croceitalea sp. MTPC9]|uniref:hypothetical protein n=1 Tax=unclassified Croceitalea TaxID=2632280 RepID=UPI002B390AC3|nr:DUF6427 family protein [Croceitalea sp. MTPC6]GMN16577.1 DUF6427 family protein [Croceitalea sp. MTPC9]